MHDSVRDGFVGFSIPLEGEVRFMYLDVKSLVSTGIGNLLDADDSEHFGTNPVPLPDVFALAWTDRNTGAAADHDDILDEYKTVKFSGTAHATLAQKEQITRLRITTDDITTLVSSKLDSFETTLVGRPDFADYPNWPADGQLALLSMAWGLGPAFHFPLFQAAAAAGDWLGMAAQCSMSTVGNPGVIPRNVRNQLLFTIADWNAADPPGDFSTLIYDTSAGVTLADNMRSGAFPIPINLDIGLQTALESLARATGTPGWDPHGLDGVWGPGTRGAIVAFQNAHGLAATPGASHLTDVGQATMDAVTAALDDQGLSYWP